MANPAGQKRMTVKRRERAIKALDLRRAGIDYRTIGRTLGISHVQAQHDVRDILAETAREPAEEVRQLELDRLDRMQAGHFAKAVKGEKGATEMVLKIMDRRARYLGLDAPAAVDVTATVHSGIEKLLADAPTPTDPTD